MTLPSPTIAANGPENRFGVLVVHNGRVAPHERGAIAQTSLVSVATPVNTELEPAAMCEAKEELPLKKWDNHPRACGRRGQNRCSKSGGTLYCRR